MRKIWWHLTNDYGGWGREVPEWAAGVSLFLLIVDLLLFAFLGGMGG